MRSLKELIRDYYDFCVKNIQYTNTTLERQFFTANINNIPLGELLAGGGFDDHFNTLKKEVQTGKKLQMDNSFALLRDLFLFSSGHDLIFKKKLQADCFVSTPLKSLIYEKMEKTIEEKFNDVSVMRENPNYDDNLKQIMDMVDLYTEANSLMYLLYAYDFQFPNDWEKLYENISDEIVSILDDIKIGEFLHALVDYKISIMKDIFTNVPNEQERNSYLLRIEKLSQDQHNKIETYTHVGSPMTYFKNNTMMDFVNLPKDTNTLIVEKTRYKN